MKDMKELMRSMSQKKESSLSDNETKAKMDVLKELLAMASKSAGDEVIDGLRKVTVASPTTEGLEAGLDKAKHMTEKLSSHATTDSDASRLSDMMDDTDDDDDSDMHQSESDEEMFPKKSAKDDEEDDEEDYY